MLYVPFELKFKEQYINSDRSRYTQTLAKQCPQETQTSYCILGHQTGSELWLLQVKTQVPTLSVFSCIWLVWYASYCVSTGCKTYSRIHLFDLSFTGLGIFNLYLIIPQYIGGGPGMQQWPPAHFEQGHCSCRHAPTITSPMRCRIFSSFFHLMNNFFCNQTFKLHPGTCLLHACPCIIYVYLFCCNKVFILTVSSLFTNSLRSETCSDNSALDILNQLLFICIIFIVCVYSTTTNNSFLFVIFFQIFFFFPHFYL